MNMLYDIMFFIIFAMAIVAIVVVCVKGICQWNRNNKSPRLTVEAIVVSRRESVTIHQHSHGEGIDHVSRSTTYYAR